MTRTETAELALLGGTPAVTADTADQWQRPIEEEKAAACELIEQGRLSEAGSGLPKQFEEEFRRFVDCEYCLTVNHGATGLTSALFAVGVGPGDEAIAPAAGYIGFYSGALHLGARPVFADIDARTLLIDPEDVERKITDRTRAIVPIHMNGRVCDMDRLIEIGARHGIPIVQDAAHAHCSEWDGKRIGTVGDLACFSLQGTAPNAKPVAGGEGGIVTTNNRAYYERQLIYCHLHRAGVVEQLTDPAYQDLDSEVLGLKWRAHPIALALARISLSSLTHRNKRMLANRHILFDALRELPGFEPVHTYDKSKAGGFFGGLRVIYHAEELDGLPAGRFMEAMRAEGAPMDGLGIGRLEHLRSIFTKGFDLWGSGRSPLQGEFAGLPPFQPYRKGDFPVAEEMSEKVLRLPAYVEPADGFLDQYIQAFKKITAHCQTLIR